jgi:hypothetical protein
MARRAVRRRTIPDPTEADRAVLAALRALHAGRPWRAYELLLRAAEAVPGFAGTAEHALLSDALRLPAVEFVRRHGRDAVPPQG